MKNKTILIIAAHPDDETLGCGATAAKLASLGNKIYTLILGEGITARDDKRDVNKRKTDLKILQNQARAANKIFGTKSIFFASLPDNRFDTVPFLDIVKSVEKIIQQIRPSVIFTHWKNDLNIDHRITHQAVLTASRPLPGEKVREIYAFEILSSSRWNYPFSFSPNIFFEVTDFIGKKIEAIKKYRSELEDYPHPRSTTGILVNAKYWGMHIGVHYAEAFEAVRILK